MSTPLDFDIPIPPVRETDFGSLVWKRWFLEVQKKLAGAITVYFTQLSFVDSNLTSLETRNHFDLQNLNSTNYYHLTQIQYTDLTDGGETTLHAHQHNNMLGIQGGASNDYFHLTGAQQAGLTGGTNTTLHYHDSDRARANHTGTQLATTISDFTSTAQALIDASLVTAKEKIEYNVPVAGFSKTISDTTNDMIFKPAGTLATGTVTMPATPSNEQVVRIASTQIITALTHSPNAGQTLNGALTTIVANGYGSWIYRAADTSWYRNG
jgi:hypothetical protein